MDCAKCIPPQLPGNEDAEMVYMAVQDQVIVGGMGGNVIAVNQLAVHAAIDVYGIIDKATCFDKVVMVSRAVIKAEREAKE